MENKTTQKTQDFRLLLSSFGFNSPIMQQKFARVICQNETLRQKTCLVISYAGFNAEKTFEREKQGLVNFGFSPGKIENLKSSSDLERLRPDYIYVAGGDPFKLLKAINDIGAREAIADCVKNKGATYIGVSAGADIATKSIEYVSLLEDNNVIQDGQFEALGLLSEGVLCHFDHRSYTTLKACREIVGGTVVTINDDQLLSYQNGEFEYVGDEE